MKRGYADFSAGQIHYQTEGTGDEVIICLHQGPLSSNEFLKMVPILAQSGYRCIAIDLPGYGKSDKVPSTTEAADFATFVKEFMEALNIKKASFLASKLGATIAAELSIQYPDLVDKLALHGLPGFDDETREKLLKSWRYSTQFTELAEDGSHLIKIWERERKWGPSAGPDLWQQAVVDALTAGRESYQGYHAMFRYSEMDRAPLVEAPTLLITGPNDIFNAFQEQFNKLISRSKIANIEELEGLCMLMIPEKISKIFVDFLKNPGV